MTRPASRDPGGQADPSQSKPFGSGALSVQGAQTGRLAGCFANRGAARIVIGN